MKRRSGKYLPDIASGKRLAAFGLTEANAGSDAGGRSRPRPPGPRAATSSTGQNSGSPTAGEAEIYTVIAMTDRSKGPRGASALILEKGMPGFEFGKKREEDGDPGLGDARARLQGLFSCLKRT